MTPEQIDRYREAFEREASMVDRPEMPYRTPEQEMMRKIKERLGIEETQDDK